MVIVRLAVPNITNCLRIFLTYVAPVGITGYVIFCGLWIVPDGVYGMYGNVDGKWTSWSARAILEWSSFLNFGPYSPLHGTGSLFTPNLPWLNPGALALGLPVAIEYQHLFSYIIYLIELTLSLYFLFLELEIKKEYAFAAVLLYISFFFIPFSSVSLAPSWYTLGPFLCHQTAAMNVATIAILRCGLFSLRLSLLWSLVFVGCLFSAFSTAPIFSMIYIPVYTALWGGVSVSSQLDRRAIPFRLGLIVVAVAFFFTAGVPNYVLATAAVSARDNGIPPFLHPGMALLTVKYWVALFSNFTTCSMDHAYFLICPSKAPAGWVQIVALVGGAVMSVFDRGRRRAFAIVSVAMIILFHFYFLIGTDYVLGRVHVVGYHYLYWTLFPLLFGVALAGIATFIRTGLSSNMSVQRWLPAIGSTAISIVGLLIFVNIISVRQPRMTGEGVLGFPPIAHSQVHKGDIHRYLEERIALAPGKPFTGYAGLYLGADDGFVRKLYPTENGGMSHDIYVGARDTLYAQFGNMFQLTDLWDSNIPTLEDYGQWLTKQMFVFNSDLLAFPGDLVDKTGVATHIYRFSPAILAGLGVRYVVSDGLLNDPLITEVAQEKSKVNTTLRLYEIEHANLGNYSPTNIFHSDDYRDAITKLRNWQADTVILLESVTMPSDVVPASHSQLTVTKGGYRITAQSSGTSLLVLPVQFSHCWELLERSGTKASIFRANLVQTGIQFQGNIDADLRFEFGLTKPSCRKQDGDDMSRFRSEAVSKG